MLEGECRDELLARKQTCEEETCPPCMVQCTTPAVKTAAGVIKCTIVSDQIGFAYGLEVSDQGQLAKSLHDADRGTNYIAVCNPCPSPHLLNIFLILFCACVQIPQKLAVRSYMIIIMRMNET